MVPLSGYRLFHLTQLLTVIVYGIVSGLVAYLNVMIYRYVVPLGL